MAITAGLVVAAVAAADVAALAVVELPETWLSHSRCAEFGADADVSTGEAGPVAAAWAGLKSARKGRPAGDNPASGAALIGLGTFMGSGTAGTVAMVVESADGATNTDDADDGRVTLAADDAARRTAPTGLAVRLARGPAAPARDAGEGLLAPVVWRAETFWALSDPVSAAATPAPLARAAPTPNVTAPAPNQTYLSVRRPLARCLPLPFTDLAFDRVDARFISTSPASGNHALTCADIASVRPVCGN